jgi:tetratricopeptide (TPR) repeat protein
VALFELKRYQEALEAYDQAIHLDPNYAMTYNNKGTSLNRLKRYEEALAAIEQAIRLNPDYAAAYSSKGKALNRSQAV